MKLVFLIQSPLTILVLQAKIQDCACHEWAGWYYIRISLAWQNIRV